MKAQHGDTITIKIVGVGPTGIPNAIELRYLRNGQALDPEPSGKQWAILRHRALELVRQWWAEMHAE